jgi:hypothetical protein
LQATLSPSGATGRPIRTRRAVITLIILAGLVGETLASFNTTPLAMLSNPILTLGNPVIYGAAALFIREVVLRRRLGWASWILLGIAYSALNEGVGAVQWYVPQVSTLPPTYGHALGVNWSWIPALAIFHTAYSMVIPIRLTEACFPSLTERPWLGRKGFVAVSVITVLLGVLFCFIKAYQPGRLAAFGIMLALGVLAMLLPARPPRVGEVHPAPSLWALRGAGFGMQVLLFAIYYLAPRLVPPFVTVMLLLAFAGWLIWQLRIWTMRTAWTTRHTVALITGAFGVTLLLSLLPPVFITGEGIAEIAWFIFLARLAAYVNNH